MIVTVLLAVAEARVRELEQKLAAAERELRSERDRRVEHRQMNQSLNEQVQRREAEVTRLTAERDEARAEVERARRAYQTNEIRVADVESQLAAANALLVRAEKALEALGWGLRAGSQPATDIHYHLSSQPAAPKPDPLLGLQIGPGAVAPCNQPGPPDPRDAEIARLSDAFNRAHDRELALETEVARLTAALAAAERSKSHWKGVCDESDHDGMAWKDRAEAAEQKLAEAERSEKECERLLEVKMRERDTAEARVRWLEAWLTNARHANGELVTKLAAAEFELPQLRERVEELEAALAGASADAETELAARNAAESELAQLREELRIAKMDPVARVCEAVDELRARARRGQ